MLFRFSAYGFLKNLRLFEAFLVLAFLERGLDFLAIGGLIAIREIAVNVCEIPSGVLADALGRKRCMVASMASYVAAYLLLGLADAYALLASAMIFYGVGDAFRSGTHKALIYSWLRLNQREHERTRVYGYTRSWSKIGSAVSALIAAAVVFYSRSYTAVFLWSALPAALNLLNLATYPAALDRDRPRGGQARFGWSALRESLGPVFHHRPLRRLMADSVALEGAYAAVKDYLQPVVQHAALSAPFLLAASGRQRTAVLGGIAYAILFLLGSFASRHAHRWESSHVDTERAIARLYRWSLVAYAALAIGLAADLAWVAIATFVGMGVVQNLWRPIHIGRFDRDGPEHLGATTLSIESQARALTAAILAPAIGALIDLLADNRTPVPLPALLPATLGGVLVGTVYLMSVTRTPRTAPAPPE